MNKDFIPYQEALELKELGFDEPCFATIDQTEFIHIKGTKYPIRGAMVYLNTDAPLYQQAFRWFREKYGLHAVIFPNSSGEAVWCIRWYVDGMQKDTPYIKGSHTYQEKELACLKKLIELVKSQTT